MKRRFFSKIAAVSALFFVTGSLLGCPDDGPDYGTCDELKNAVITCGYGQALAAEIACDNMYYSGDDPIQPDYDNCLEAAYAPLYSCLGNDSVCGGASFDKCSDHFEEECPDEKF